MVETEIAFHNKTETRVQAQVFTGRTLASTCVAGPGESCGLLAKSLRYDIFLRNAATGWEIARRLDSDAKSFTVSQHKRQYTIHEAGGSDSLDTVSSPELAIKH